MIFSRYACQSRPADRDKGCPCSSPLKTGIKVLLDHFYIALANVVLDRDAETHHAAFARLISRLFTDCEYAVVIDYSRQTQGAFACVAVFTSIEYQPNPDAWGSTLILGWYADHQDRELRDLARTGIDLCDWERQCKPIYWN